MVIFHSYVNVYQRVIIGFSWDFRGDRSLQRRCRPMSADLKRPLHSGWWRNSRIRAIWKKTDSDLGVYIYIIYIYYIPTSPSPISWEFASSLELFSKVCATVFWVFLRRPRLQTPHHGGVHRVSGQDPRRDDWARCGAGHLWGIANHLTSSSIYNSSLPCRTYT